MTKKISELLNNFLPLEHRWKIKLFKNWENIIGEFKNKVVILKIERSVLTLGVYHPVWAQELFCLSDLFKEKINFILGKNYIKYIRFKVVFKKNNNFCRKAKNYKKCQLSFTDSNYMNFKLTKNEEDKLLPIQDIELKKSLKEFCLRSKRMRNEKNISK